MAQGSDSNDTSYKSPSPASRAGSSDDVKKVMRREKNRIAAQKSRMRQTQKADSLHLNGLTLEPITSSDVVTDQSHTSVEDGTSVVPTLAPQIVRTKESENLEKENAALRKEVKQLTEEAKYLSSVLSSHEPLCSGLTPTTPDLIYPSHHGAFHQHIAASHYQH